MSGLWWELRYKFRPNSFHDRPYFLSYVYEDGRLEHVAMDGLQFGRHQELAANYAGLIRKALAVPSLGTDLLSLSVNDRAILLSPQRRGISASVPQATLGSPASPRGSSQMDTLGE
jgi:hypothetical protein